MLDQTEQDVSLSPQEFIAGVTQADNIASIMSSGQLDEIARDCLRDYELDKQSMNDWFKLMKRGLNLAQLVKEDKSYPFQGAANIKYPLIASAALQFNARAYPAIVPSDQIVRTKINGKDPMGKKAARGERVSAFMSHQLSNDIEEWEEATDQLLLLLPIVGHMYRKKWFDPVKKRPCVRLCEPGKVIVNNNIKSLEDAPRISEEMPLYPFEIEGRIRSGFFVEFKYDTDEDDQAAQDFVEQHTRMDLDKDGYPEPYVVTIHVETKTVVRLVADFTADDVEYEMETQPVPQPVVVQGPMGPMQTMQVVPQQVAVGIIGIRRGSYFVDYRFWPGMDGKYHGCGLGMLLGDISDTVNTIFNQLLDAGHYASLGGGFIGSEFRIKGGAHRHRPGEWKLTQATGSDIKSSIVPLTFPGPNGTLYEMLGMLIEAGREISSTKDIMTGDTGTKNMTATTTLALIEQGMMVFTAVYKRIYRSLRKEYRLLARLNAETLDPQIYNAFLDEMDQQGQPIMFDPAEDFGAADMDVVPVADPRSVTKQQEMAKADLVMQMAGQGLANPQVAAARIFEAANIEDAEELVPQPDPMQVQMGQIQAQIAQADLAQRMADIDKTLAEMAETRTQAIKNVADAEATMIEQRLKMTEMILTDEREKILELIRAASRGMAGTPGNGGVPRNAAQAGGRAPQGGFGGIPGGNGPGQVGAGPAGMPVPAAIGGGLV